MDEWRIQRHRSAVSYFGEHQFNRPSILFILSILSKVLAVSLPTASLRLRLAAPGVCATDFLRVNFPNSKTRKWRGRRQETIKDLQASCSPATELTRL